jgi:hypothetical protein
VRVHSDLVLCGVADQTFVVGERNIRGGGAISLVICNDFYTIILPHTHATKRYISTMKGMKRLNEMLTSRLCQGNLVSL